MEEAERKILGVAELNNFIKGTVEGNPYLKRVCVRGEISNFGVSNGNAYFTLKDEGSRIGGLIFRNALSRIPFTPESGMKVVVTGSVTVYAVGGTYSINVLQMEPDGIGLLAIKYEQLKRKLEAEGLFDKAHKRPLPRYPKRIGVITSPTGAAVRDIINVTGRRFPYSEILIFPSLVQGDGAVANLIEGMRYFGAGDKVDVIIIGRGGGSIEDLWAFNDEGLAREIYASKTPVISAVGHETDFTICDFVADLRAPTPSAAAENAVPDINKVLEQFDNAKKRLKMLLRAKTDNLSLLLERYSRSPFLRSPKTYIEGKKNEKNEASRRLSEAFSRYLTDRKTEIVNYSRLLDVLSPLKTISKGFTAVTDRAGKSVRSINDVENGDELTLMLADGDINATVDGREAKNRTEKYNG